MPTKTSKLCKTLLEILGDTHSHLSMLDYFIQYTESVGALHMVQFWLSVESFRVTAHKAVKPPSPTKPRENRTRPNTLDENGRTPRKAASPLSPEVLCLVKGSPEESRAKKSHEKPPPHDGSRTIHGTPQTSNGSPRSPIGSPRDQSGHGGSRTPASSPGTPGSNGRDKHRVLQRRDTENHKYCNCKIHGLHQQESPSSSSRIHGLGCSGGDVSSSVELHNHVHDSPAMVTRSQNEPSPVVNRSNQSSPGLLVKRSDQSLPTVLIGSQHQTQSNHVVQSLHQHSSHKLS